MKHLLGEVLQLVIRFLVFLYKKVGINGIFVLILPVELLVMGAYYDSQSDQYLYDNNYILSEVIRLEKLSPEDARLKANNIVIEQGQVGYLALIQIDNLYSSEVRYLSIDAKSQDGSYILCRELDYYGEEAEGREVIPAGASGKVPFVVIMEEEEAKGITSLTFYQWDSDEKEPSNAVTVGCPKGL